MTTKRFLRLQVIIILMFTLTLICHTFSWATRPAVQGGGFMGGGITDGDSEFTMDKTYFTAIKLVTPDYHVNGTGCSAVTYRAVIDEETGNVKRDRQGKIKYDDKKPVNLDGEISIEADLTPDDALYFKTVITNSSENVITNTSIFVDAKYHTVLNTNVMIGITTPVTKASVLVTKDEEDNSTGMHTVKWYPILAGIEIEPEGSRIVEWCIYNSSIGDTGKFVLDNIYFTNN